MHAASCRALPAPPHARPVPRKGGRGQLKNNDGTRIDGGRHARSGLAPSATARSRARDVGTAAISSSSSSPSSSSPSSSSSSAPPSNSSSYSSSSIPRSSSSSSSASSSSSPSVPFLPPLISTVVERLRLDPILSGAVDLATRTLFSGGLTGGFGRACA